jgi:S-layer homology domain
MVDLETRFRPLGRSLVLATALAGALAAGAGAAFLDNCGPFTDVPLALCPYVSELYFLGITVGTSATTFSPDAPLTRGQASVFVAKSFDQSVARSSRRAALNQWWTSAPQYSLGLALTHVPFNSLGGLASDGADVWAASQDETGNGAVTRIRASDGKALDTWNIPGASAVLVALGRIFAGGYVSPNGFLYMIDPLQPAGPVSSVTNALPQGVIGLAFDGTRIWTANFVSGGGSVSIVTPAAAAPWPATTVTTGIASPFDVLFDGSNVWVVDTGTLPGSLLKLDAGGNVLQSVPVGIDPRYATFDGTNIWVPNIADSSVTVVQASTGAVLATLTGNGLSLPWAAAFDGQRVMITQVGPTVSLFKAADLSPIGSASIGAGGGYGVCSDGINFWISLSNYGAVGRF